MSSLWSCDTISLIWLETWVMWRHDVILGRAPVQGRRFKNLQGVAFGVCRVITVSVYTADCYYWSLLLLISQFRSIDLRKQQSFKIPETQNHTKKNQQLLIQNHVCVHVCESACVCVTAVRSLWTTADTMIGRMMLVAPPTLLLAAMRGGVEMPWRRRPATAHGGGAEKQTNKPDGKQETVALLH